MLGQGLGKARLGLSRVVVLTWLTEEQEEFLLGQFLLGVRPLH